VCVAGAPHAGRTSCCTLDACALEEAAASPGTAGVATAARVAEGWSWGVATAGGKRGRPGVATAPPSAWAKRPRNVFRAPSPLEQSPGAGGLLCNERLDDAAASSPASAEEAAGTPYATTPPALSSECADSPSPALTPEVGSACCDGFTIFALGGWCTGACSRCWKAFVRYGVPAQLRQTALCAVPPATLREIEHGLEHLGSAVRSYARDYPYQTRVCETVSGFAMAAAACTLRAAWGALSGRVRVADMTPEDACTYVVSMAAAAVTVTAKYVCGLDDAFREVIRRTETQRRDCTVPACRRYVMQKADLQAAELALMRSVGWNLYAVQRKPELEAARIIFIAEHGGRR